MNKKTNKEVKGKIEIIFSKTHLGEMVEKIVQKYEKFKTLKTLFKMLKKSLMNC